MGERGLVTINSALVRIDQTHEDMHGNIHIYSAISQNNARIWGTVESEEIILSGRLYGHFDQPIRKGDKVYFHYGTVEFDPLYDNVWKIEYGNIFCIVRDGEIIPVGDWFLATPVFEDETEEIEVAGKKMNVIMSKSGLVASASPRKSAIRLKTEVIDHEIVKPGMTAYLLPPIHFNNHIEGKDYYTCERKYLLGYEL